MNNALRSQGSGLNDWDELRGESRLSVKYRAHFVRAQWAHRQSMWWLGRWWGALKWNGVVGTGHAPIWQVKTLENSGWGCFVGWWVPPAIGMVKWGWLGHVGDPLTLSNGWRHVAEQPSVYSAHHHSISVALHHGHVTHSVFERGTLCRWGMGVGAELRPLRCVVGAWRVVPNVGRCVVGLGRVYFNLRECQGAEEGAGG
jgi:hypothetical protein